MINHNKLSNLIHSVNLLTDYNKDYPLLISKLESMSNCTYKVSYTDCNNNESSYLCKVMNFHHSPFTNTQIINKSNRINTLIDNPDYIYAYNNDLKIATRRFDDNYSVLTGVSNDEYYKLVLSELRYYHSINLSDHYKLIIGKFDPLEYFSYYLAKLKEKDDQYDTHFVKYLDDMNKYDYYLSSKYIDKQVLSHCDLVSNNILYNKVLNTVKFIDFEYSGVAPREFDLSTLFMYSDKLTINEFDKYVNDYYSHTYDKELFKLSMRVQLGLWIVWSYYYIEYLDESMSKYKTDLIKYILYLESLYRSKVSEVN